MRGERTRDRDALIDKYGMSARLAARVLALQSEKIDLSRSILETAVTDPSLQKLLLNRDLLDQPESLTSEWLQKQADDCGVEDADLLRTVEGEDGWTTIAFEDDVLAEGMKETAPEHEVDASMVRAEDTEISRRETEELFSPEEVAKLRLTALTSQETGERIEALRKLIYAPLDDSARASIFVRALIDPDAAPEVRQQAVRCLQEIGFREDFARTVHALFKADDQDVLYAIRRLDSMLDEADDSERSVALAVVLRIFDESDRPPVLQELLGLISDSVSVLTQHRNKTEQFVQTGLRKLTRFYAPLSDELLATLRQSYETAPDIVGPLLWKELDRSSDPRVRAFIVHLLSRVMEEDDNREKLADAAIEELLNTDLPEDHRTQLRYSLLRMGEATVHVANQRLTSGSDRRNAELVRVLDVVCTEADTPTKMVNETVQALLDTLKIGDRITRRRIVEASVISDSRARPELRQQVAEELLAHIGEFGMENTVDTICHTLEQIGPPAIDPLFDFIRRRYPQQDADSPLRSLGRIAEKWREQIPDDQVEEVLGYCIDLLDDSRASRGTFTITLAYFVGYTRPGAIRFGEILDQLIDLTGTAGFTFDVFEALGILAGSPNIAPEHQQKLFDLFRDVLHMKTPGTQGVRKETEEGPVYEFGPEMMFDTRLLPSVVRGLKQIGVSAATSDDLRREVVKELLILWEGVSNVRVVWGPGAMGALVEAISAVACSDHVSSRMRTRLGHSILRFLNKVNVVRSIGAICARPAEDEQMRELCLEAGTRMLEEWQTCEEQDQERRIALLESLSRVAANKGLDSSDKDVEHLRKNVMDALFRALREGIDEAREPLERLRDCPALMEDKREKIRDRLTRVYGLVQTHEE